MLIVSGYKYSLTPCLLSSFVSTPLNQEHTASCLHRLLSNICQNTRKDAIAQREDGQTLQVSVNLQHLKKKTELGALRTD